MILLNTAASLRPVYTVGEIRVNSGIIGMGWGRERSGEERGQWEKRGRNREVEGPEAGDGCVRG